MLPDGGGKSAPKKSKKIDLNIESLYKTWEAMQRRNPGLRDVRLELLNKKAPEGQLAYFMAENVQSYGGAKGRARYDKEINLGPTMRLFLPSLKKSFSQFESYPKIANSGSRLTPLTVNRDLTKWIASVLRHEAAHALNQKQANIGATDIPVKPNEATEASRLNPTTPDWPSNVHEKRFQTINRGLGGFSNEPVMPKIGIPPELARLLIGKRSG